MIKAGDFMCEKEGSGAWVMKKLYFKTWPQAFHSDAVVIGEAEDTWPMLIEDFSSIYGKGHRLRLVDEVIHEIETLVKRLFKSRTQLSLNTRLNLADRRYSYGRFK